MRLIPSLVIMFLLLILPSNFGSVEGSACLVPSGFPDVSTAISNGCTNIYFDGNVVEPGPVNIIGLSNILVDGNSYTWVITAPNYISIIQSSNITFKDVIVLRNGPLHTIYVERSREIVLDNVFIQASSSWWRSALLINQSDSVLISKTTVIDNGISSRSKIYLLDSNATLVDVAVYGTFWGVEINNSVAHTGLMNVSIINLTASAAHYGFIVRVYDWYPTELYIDSLTISGSQADGFYGYFNVASPPIGPSKIYISGSRVIDSQFNNLFIELYGLSNLYLNLSDSILVDSDVWRNLALLASGSSTLYIDVANLTVAEDGIAPSENVLIYSDTVSTVKGAFTSLSLRDALSTNFRIVALGSSSQDILIMNSNLTLAGQYNLASYQDHFSFLNLNISKSSFENALNTNIVFYTQGSASIAAYVDGIYAFNAPLNNLYIGGFGQSTQYIEVRDSSFNLSTLQNIKIDYNSNIGSPKTVFVRVNTSQASYGLVYWSINSVGTSVEVHESIINRFWVWDVPGATSLMLLNETMYDELSSQNDGGTVISRWTLKVSLLSSLTGYPVTYTPIDFYDSNVFITVSYTDNFGVSYTTFTYGFDESNPFIDQLVIRVSTPYHSLSYSYLADGGLSVTLPSIFGGLTLELSVFVLRIYGYVNNIPSVIEFYGGGGLIKLLDDTSILEGHMVVKVYRFTVLGYRVVGDYIIVNILLPFPKPVVQTFIYDRDGGVAVSHGLNSILGWKI